MSQNGLRLAKQRGRRSRVGRGEERRKEGEGEGIEMRGGWAGIAISYTFCIPIAYTLHPASLFATSTTAAAWQHDIIPLTLLTPHTYTHTRTHACQKIRIKAEYALPPSLFLLIRHHTHKVTVTIALTLTLTLTATSYSRTVTELRTKVGICTPLSVCGANGMRFDS